MNKPYFIETIKVVDGRFLNLTYHMDRMNRTMISFFNTTMFVELWIGDIPEELRTGVVKCRITYSHCSVNVEYERYHMRKVNSLKLTEDNSIDYSFKYADRSSLIRLLEQKGDCDDILIVNDGFITDTSYTNIVLKNSSGLYTPSTCLLAGTKRQLLIDRGFVKEKDIHLADLQRYDQLYLINAMIDIEDNVSIPVNCLF